MSRYAHHGHAREGELTFDELCRKIAELANAAASPTAIDNYSDEKLAQVEDLVRIARACFEETRP